MLQDDYHKTTDELTHHFGKGWAILDSPAVQMQMHGAHKKSHSSTTSSGQPNCQKHRGLIHETGHRTNPAWSPSPVTETPKESFLQVLFRPMGWRKNEWSRSFNKWHARSTALCVFVRHEKSRLIWQLTKLGWNCPFQIIWVQMQFLQQWERSNLTWHLSAEKIPLKVAELQSPEFACFTWGCPMLFRNNTLAAMS